MSRRRRAIESDLEAQISDLRDELASMASMLSKQGSAAYDETRGAASDLYEGISTRLHDALPVITRRARSMERTARDNPVLTTAVGIAVVGLAISFLATRR
jgi:ElaB/YqjD/DUF883 family membrane-anchored ribosome-binding protein